MDQFTVAFPDIEVEFYCKTSTVLQGMVEEDKLDLVMIEEPISVAVGDILRVEPLVWMGEKHTPNGLCLFP